MMINTLNKRNTERKERKEYEQFVKYVAIGIAIVAFVMASILKQRGF